MVFIQGWHLLSSASITSDHYSRAAIIKAAVFNQVNTIIPELFSYVRKYPIILELFSLKLRPIILKIMPVH